jgi:hypothetical protein
METQRPSRSESAAARGRGRLARSRFLIGPNRRVEKKPLTIKKLEPAPIETSSSTLSAPALAASGPEAPESCVFAATLGKINIHFARKAAEAPFQP